MKKIKKLILFILLGLFASIISSCSQATTVTPPIELEAVDYDENPENSPVVEDVSSRSAGMKGGGKRNDIDG